jgi:tetratricopeptide (TPR) repeat protein
VAIFTVRLLYNGFSFGEAAYACQPVLSWQTTVVGDPLYRPGGENLEQVKDNLLWRNSKLSEWYYLRLLNINLANGKPVSECAGVLESFEQTKRSAVLMEKLGDLYAAQGKPSSAADACAKAIKLDPSPQQRLRLLLTLTARLSALDRNAEAYANCQQLLELYPQYPDRVSLFRKLVALAQKLNKKAEAEKYDAQAQAESRPAADKAAKR